MQRLGRLFALVMGATVTFLLLYVMQALLGGDARHEDAGIRVRIADIAPPGPSPAVQPEATRPQKIPDPPRPPRMELRERDLLGGTPGPASDPGGVPDPGSGIDPVHGAAPADVEHLPIVKVAAIYPRRAQTRGITGYCIVEYTVTTSGATRDPVAVDCQPAGVFEASSLRAVLGFKYRPRMVDGRPVEVRGVRNQFVFELDR